MPGLRVRLPNGPAITRLEIMRPDARALIARVHMVPTAATRLPAATRPLAAPGRPQATAVKPLPPLATRRRPEAMVMPGATEAMLHPGAAVTQ